MPRSRRSTAARASPATPSRPNRSRKVKEETESAGEDMDVDGYEDPDDEEDVPGPSKRSKARKPRASAAKKRRIVEDDATELSEDEVSTHSRRRSSKQVSYKEIPIDNDEADDDDDAEEEEDEEEEEEEEEVKVEKRSTPARRGRKAKEDKGDKPYKKEGGGGRGGFSVKGAAAAAARARWDKVRRERAERGEDPDETPRSRRTNTVTKKDPRGALENVIEGHKYSIKGQEYVAADDELILPDDPKGDTKIDAEGHLLGGREYKLVTFTSPTRKNPNRVYALTIDAARACGYTDSLAFLRRCPQIVKLSCNPEEREMLIEVGRITGNLKHRMVTMVAMRNVYKLMGARLVKDGKWVDDDYNEEQALQDCANNGYKPHGPVTEEELAANQYPSAGGPRPAASQSMYADGQASKSTLASFYPAGGATTQFGSNGADPWADNLNQKRHRLRQLGVTEEDWMLRTAEDSRRIDETLRGIREERITELEGVDATRGWVYATERYSEGLVKKEPQHPLARELSLDAAPSSDALSPAPPESAVNVALAEANGNPETEQAERRTFEGTPGGKIVVENEAETVNGRPRKGKWTPGVIRAAYEPHTQMPHVPLSTQPTYGSLDRVAYKPLIGLESEARLKTAPGIASVEFAFNPTHAGYGWLDFGDGIQGAHVAEQRTAAVKAAEEWERSLREQRKQRRSEVS
ncbi:protein-nucleus import-related protein [Trichosporon asahii var. asahii CBS 8904]|uniref:Protein-nucleus import-related protein n=2 Tax=Trichosporon asahii var. asahii TaxID=189963 RepID=K1VIK9_TRIAC|nr:protein-nucleus import-related protein [Trichosporon asahii var. asahii CBS 2479]EJT50068.1 protein-nucleus import-related protein [Trichosporon asahii var. asahii CBS 2479]EKD00596.1 protein-nucleus import-related protein [Trichosporon asahii var. asahii CBS 8904]